MKKKITVEKNTTNNTINFYLVVPKLGHIFLFTTYFSKGLMTYFEGGRSYDEILSFSKWGRNPRLDRIINRLPGLVKYGMIELLEEQEMKRLCSKAKRKHSDTSCEYFMDAA